MEGRGGSGRGAMLGRRAGQAHAAPSAQCHRPHVCGALDARDPLCPYVPHSITSGWASELHRGRRLRLGGGACAPCRRAWKVRAVGGAYSDGIPACTAPSSHRQAQLTSGAAGRAGGGACRAGGADGAQRAGALLRGAKEAGGTRQRQRCSNRAVGAGGARLQGQVAGTCSSVEQGTAKAPCLMLTHNKLLPDPAHLAGRLPRLVLVAAARARVACVPPDRAEAASAALLARAGQ